MGRSDRTLTLLQKRFQQAWGLGGVSVSIEGVQTILTYKGLG